MAINMNTISTIKSSSPISGYRALLGMPKYSSNLYPCKNSDLQNKNGHIVDIS